MSTRDEKTPEEAAKRIGELCNEAMELAVIAGLVVHIKIKPAPKERQ